MSNHCVSVCILFVALEGALALRAAAQVAGADAYRRFALIHQGDVARGLMLFQEREALACANCHSVDGRATKAGPDLFATGDSFGRRDLIDAILRPSATISPGYGTVIVETKAGATFVGVLKQTTDAALQLMGADGKLISIARAEIKEESGSSVSLMPEGLHAALSLEEFADLIEYLTTLKQPESTLLSNEGLPRVLHELAKPVNVRPFFATEFRLPRSRAETGLTSLHQVPGFNNLFLDQAGNIYAVGYEGMIYQLDFTEARFE